MDKYEGAFERYGDRSPTPFDRHLEIQCYDEDSREHWYVMPVYQDRDSKCRAQSNFESFLKELGGESETVEVHRFGHWGHGWYETIIVNPADEKAMEIAYDCAGYLQNDSSVLDTEDLSRREMEDIDQSWDAYGYAYGYSDVLKAMLLELESGKQENGDTTPADDKQRWCKNWGLATDICGCGDCILMEDERIDAAITIVDNLDSDKLRELARDCGMTEHYLEGSSPFYYDFSWYQLLEEVEDLKTVRSA